jgi:hypothetical protein
MKLTKTLICRLLVVVTATCALSLTSPVYADTPLKFDEFGRIPCAEEKARVDNYGRALQEQANGLAAVLVYAGRGDTRSGEVVARLFGIRDRLTGVSSIDPNRILIFEGGYREKLKVELWILPPGSREAAMFLRDSQMESKASPLKGPRIERWDFKCPSAR